MRRKLTFAALVSLSLVSHPGWALGVGAPVVASTLDAPLRAQIPLRDVAGSAGQRLQVSLADPAAFAQAGLEYRPLMDDIDLRLRQHQEHWVVALSSAQPVREPWLDVLLRIAGPDGEQLHAVTLLLDPPDYASRPPLAGQSSAESAESAMVPANVVAERAASETVWIAPGDTLWSVADRLRPAPEISVDQMMLALVEANPDAFPSGNVNALRAGHALRVPSREAIMRHSAVEADRRVAAMHTAWAQGTAGSPAANAREAKPTETPPMTEARSGDIGAEEATGEVTEPEAEPTEAPPLTSDADPVAERNEAAEPAPPPVSAVERVALETELGALREELAALREALAALRADQAAPPPALAAQAERATRRPVESSASEPSGTADTAAAAPAEETPSAGAWWEARSLAADSPLLLGSAALALLLGLGGLVWWRRREERADDTFVTLPSVAPAAAREVDAADGTPPSAGAIEGSAAGLPRAEAINEADIFMAYGRYDQAQARLDASLAEAPDSPELRFKRLALCVAQNDGAAATREAEWLRAQGDATLTADVDQLMARLAPEEGAAEAVEADAATSERAGESAPEASSTALAERETAPEHEVVSGHEMVSEHGMLTESEAERVAQLSAAAAVGAPPPQEVDESEHEATPVPRVIDYQPPPLDPGATAGRDVAADAEAEWEVEEVAFPPLGADNESPSAHDAEVTLEQARRRLAAGDVEGARQLLDPILAESDDVALREAAQRLRESAER